MPKTGFQSMQFSRGGGGTIAVIAFVLGLCASTAFLHTFPIVFQITKYFAGKELFFYILSMSVFHFGEFIMTALYNPMTCTADSFLLNQSTSFTVAYIASFIEYGIEYVFFPRMKSIFIVKLLGASLVVGGDFVRKMAMYQASSNFTHMVQERKRQDHVLVTRGIYSVSRHPSYFGWFYWAIGTQILLLNPVCILGFTIAAWKFFSDRIEEEETYLIDFFKDDYREYKKSVGTLIPFIR